MTKLFSCIFVITFLTSCRKTTPTGFWTTFHKDLIVKNISEQGPFGGHRAMFWATKNANTFDSVSIIKFATKNGWCLTKIYSFNRDSLTNWTYSGKSVFPLSHTGFDPNMDINISTYRLFPMWINSNVKVYQFKTDWVAIDPGTDNSINENGFVVVNDSSTKMSVYHIWGE